MVKVMISTIALSADVAGERWRRVELTGNETASTEYDRSMLAFEWRFCDAEKRCLLSNVFLASQRPILGAKLHETCEMKKILLRWAITFLSPTCSVFYTTYNNSAAWKKEADVRRQIHGASAGYDKCALNHRPGFVNIWNSRQVAHVCRGIFDKQSDYRQCLILIINRTDSMKGNPGAKML